MYTNIRGSLVNKYTVNQPALSDIISRLTVARVKYFTHSLEGPGNSFLPWQTCIALFINFNADRKHGCVHWQLVLELHAHSHTFVCSPSAVRSTGYCENVFSVQHGQHNLSHFLNSFVRKTSTGLITFLFNYAENDESPKMLSSNDFNPSYPEVLLVMFKWFMNIEEIAQQLIDQYPIYCLCSFSFNSPSIFSHLYM